MEDTGVSEAVLSRLNLATQIMCIALCTVFVGIRFFVKYYNGHQHGEVEDYCCFISWVFFMAYCALGIYTAPNGAGYYSENVSDEQMVIYRKLEYCMTLFYGLAAPFIKSALLLMVTRIFSPVRSRLCYIYTFLICMSCYYFAVLLAKAMVCIPISAYWETISSAYPRASPARCLNQRALFITDCLVSLITDTMILVLPLTLTWSLHMRREKKLRIAVLLGAGGLATLFSLYRLIIIFEAVPQDPTRLYTRLDLTAAAEIATGIICSCLPAANLFATHILKKGFQWQKDYYGSTTGQSQGQSSGQSQQPSLQMQNLSQLNNVSRALERTTTATHLASIIKQDTLGLFDFEPCRLTTSIQTSRRFSDELNREQEEEAEGIGAGIQINLSMTQTIENLGFASSSFTREEQLED